MGSHTNICSICGANYEYKNGHWVCPACGAYRVEGVSNEEVTLLYSAAQKLRLCDFDDAEKAYADIVSKYPENPEGYWGRLLSRYGIKYEEDFDGRKIPTCYAASIESVMSDKDYLKAIGLADADTKAYYINQAEYVERVRKEWIEKAKKEKPYDIFLCYKDSDLGMGIDRTEDSYAVQELYIHLTNKGYRVFFSRESLRDKVGEKYEPYIFNALSTAKAMIVYGSKSEYITSTWLKNEWTRYEKKIATGEKLPNSLIVACDGFSPNELPRVLSAMQCMDANSRSFYSDLDEHLERILRPNKKAKHASGEDPELKESEKKSGKLNKKKALPIILISAILAVAILLGSLWGAGLFNIPGIQNNNSVSHELTGITVSGDSISKTAALWASEVRESNTAVLEALAGVAEKYVAYDISLSETVSGYVTVTMPIPADMNRDRLAVYHVDDSGIAVALDSTVNGDHVSFDTNHFSVFAIVENYSDGLSYEKNVNGSFYVKKYSGTAETIIIPSKITGGFDVEGIAVSSGDSNANAIVIPKSIKHIESAEFNSTGMFDRVYYYGSMEDWKNITKNTNIARAERYYYSESVPTTAGNWWHMVNGVPTVWNQISFSANGGSGTMTSMSIETGSSASLPKNRYTRTGYTFAGWATSADGEVVYSDRATYTMGADPSVTLYAKWAPNTNTVIFNAGGGSGTMPDMSIKTGSSATLTKNSFTRPGYTFAGWGTSPNGSVKYNDQATYKIGTASTVTLYAQWTANINTIIFNANGGSGTMTGMSIETGSSVALTKNSFTKAGYTFAGWATSPNGSVKYSDRATYKMGVDSTVTLYAQWTANTNTIIFNANGGNGVMSVLGIKTGSSATLTKNSFTRSGYIFAGWATSADGEVVYSDQAIYTMGSYPPIVTLYAKWTAVPDNHNVLQFDPNGGSGSMRVMTMPAGSSVTLTKNSFTRSGYTFAGWATSADGEVVYGDGATYTMGTDSVVTLYAKWTQNTNTVVFNANGGSGSMTAMTMKTGSSATLTKNSFTRSGYTFAGWATSAGGEVVYSDGATYTMGAASAVTLYAKWTPNTNTLIFSANGGSGTMTSMSIEAGSSVRLPQNSFTKPGYVFKGWATTPYGSVRYNDQATYTMGTASTVTLYAVWETNKVEVTFNANGGTGTMETLLADKGGTVKLPECTFKKAGYKFAGWATYSGGSASYKDQASYSISNYDSKITLYAVWDPVYAPLEFTDIGGAYAVTGARISSNYYQAESFPHIVIPETYNGLPVTEITHLVDIDAIGGPYELKPLIVVVPDSVVLINSNAINLVPSEVEITVNVYCEASSKPLLWASDWISPDNTYDIPTVINMVWGSEIDGDWVYKKNGSEYTVEMYIGTDTSVKVPATYNGLPVTEISNAFSGNANLESVTIPEGIKVIGDSAFEDCTNLISVDIPNSVTSIGANAFKNSGIKTVSIGTGVTSIDKTAFDGCVLETIKVVDGNASYKSDGNCLVETSSDTLLKGTDTSTVPGTVKHINAGAFEGCTTLGSITLPSGLLTIGDHAFSGCTTLGSLTLPSGLLTIGDYAFSGCTNLKVAIPSTVTSIGVYAFENCTALDSVTVPSGVTSIGEGTFSGCSSIQSVKLLGNVTSIGKSAFSGCSSLTDIPLPDSLQSIGGDAFAGCSKLPSITIPMSVASMGHDDSPYTGSPVFDSACSRIIIYCEAKNQPSGWYSNWNASGRPVVWGVGNAHLTYTLVGDEYTVTGYTGNGTEISIPATYEGKNVTAIGENAFANNTALNTIELPAGLKAIGVGAFQGCTGLNTHILIPNGTVSIGDDAFKNCSNLRGVVIPNTVTSMGANVFSGCTKLDITCISTEQPSGWNANWNSSACEVGWGYTPGLQMSGKSITGYTGTSTVVVTPSTATRWGDWEDSALWNNSTVRTIIISSGLRSFGSLSGCGNLKEIYVPLSVTAGTTSFPEATTVYYEGTEYPVDYDGIWGWSGYIPNSIMPY